jgi:serine protease inhibitor
MRTSLVSLVAITVLGLLVHPAAEATDRAKDELATAQAKLARALIEKLASRTGTVTVSPASLALAFGIIRLGADPVMKTAIAKALTFGPQRAKDSLAVLAAVRGKLANTSDTFVIAPTSPLNEILRARLENFGLDYSVADLSNPEAAAEADAWVKEVTQERDFVAVDLPFADERYSVVVVTTTDRPASAKLFAPVANWLSGSGVGLRFGDPARPRFSVTAREDLMPALDTLGLDKARHAATALRGFAPVAMLSHLVQGTMVDVDEEGAEAAAATSFIVSRSLKEDDAIHMVVDKPFIYTLRDSATRLILAAGYAGKPPKGKTV